MPHRESTAAITRAITIATRHGIPTDDLAVRLHAAHSRDRARIATGLALDAVILAAHGQPVAHLPDTRATYWAGLHLPSVHRQHPAVIVASDLDGAWELIAGRWTRAHLQAHRDLTVLPAHTAHARALYRHSPIELRHPAMERLRLTLTTHARALPAVTETRPRGALVGATSTRRHLRPVA